MKNIFLIIIIIILTSGFALSQKGSFNIQCNPTINIELSSTPDEVRMCPGCKKDWPNGNYCLYWSVTTTTAPRTFQAIFTNPGNVQDVNLKWVWMYQENSGNWKNFNNDKNPQNAPGHPHNTFTLEANNFLCIDIVKFRVCITDVHQPCSRTPGNTGYNFAVDVNCVN
jgi:hypothetical protein